MKIIEMMNDFVSSNSNELMDVLKCDDEKILMIICTNLLSWLKCDYKKLKDNRYKYHKPMTLKPEFNWTNKLTEILITNNELSSLFVIKGNELDYNPALSYDDKMKLIEYVGNYYVPFMTRY